MDSGAISKQNHVMHAIANQMARNASVARWWQMHVISCGRSSPIGRVRWSKARCVVFPAHQVYSADFLVREEAEPQENVARKPSLLLAADHFHQYPRTMCICPCRKRARNAVEWLVC